MSRARGRVAVARAAASEQAAVWRWLLAGLVALSLMAASAAQAREVPTSFADLAEKLLPAVVNISTTQTVRQGREGGERGPEMPQFPPGSPFEDFFKEFFDRNNNRPNQPPRRATSLGSGFIVDPAGYVVTNNHVIQDAEEITVILHDDQAFKAEIVGRDTKTDLALLKISAPNKLPYVQFGSSDEARVGDWVMAIGNPFGLGGTVTVGILSARARDINAGPYDDFLQTDASINRGNSGGPMFNMKGEVIGINTAIFSPSGGSIGIGFAVPSSLARQVVADLREFGKTRRGWLGVRIQSITPEIAESLGLKGEDGALVASVSENGPAAKGGIKAGDVILTFDGKQVSEMRRLPRIVAETGIGKDVPVEVWRGGRKTQVHVKVGELDEAAEEVELAKAQPEKEKAGPVGEHKVNQLGLTVAGITPQLRAKFNLTEAAKGVVVTEVAQTGVAAEKGIRPGDTIVEVGQEPVGAPSDVTAKVDAALKTGRKSILLLVENDRGLRFVALKIDAGDPTAKR